MLKLKAFILLISSILALSTSSSQAQSCPTVPTSCIGAVPDPEPWILNNAAVTIEPYLARAIMFDGLADAHEKQSTQSKALEDIDAAVRLRAMFLLRAGGMWANVGKYSWPEYISSLPQFINAVNSKYDCAGLRRPLIQAEVLTESISDAFYDHSSTPDPARNVYIDERVIREFANEIPASQLSRYFNGTTPLNNVIYDYNNIVWSSTVNPADDCPDITKVEARMWMFQQAIIYLDAGFTSIHLGQAGYFAKLHINDSGWGQRMQQLAGFVSHIRSYAASTPTLGQNRVSISYLPISSEPMPDSNNNNIKFINGQVNGKDQLIFDFVVAAMRPREINPPGSNNMPPSAPSMDTRDRNSGLCPSDYGYLHLLDGTDCQGKPRLAVIDPCHGFYMLPDGGGVAPGNRVYDNTTPYSIYFDFGPGIAIGGAPGLFYSGREGCWGYDDARWFSAALDAPCRADWMKTELSQVRAFNNSKSFLALPGRLLPTPGIVSEYRLSQELVTLNKVCEAWAIVTPNPTITESPCAGYRVGTCPEPDPRVRPTTFLRYSSFWLSVPNPDATSIYTWHIRNITTGAWEPMTYGTTRTFTPKYEGAYEIYLKQDNIGFSDGTVNRTYSHIITVDPPCCENSANAYRPINNLFTLNYSKTSKQMFAQEASQRKIADTSATRSESKVTIDLFPQPASTNVSIKLITKTPIIVSGTVFDLIGRKICSIITTNYTEAGTHLLNIDTHVLPTGMYTATLWINGNMEKLKIMIE